MQLLIIVVEDQLFRSQGKSVLLVRKVREINIELFVATPDMNLSARPNFSYGGRHSFHCCSITLWPVRAHRQCKRILLPARRLHKLWEQSPYLFSAKPRRGRPGLALHPATPFPPRPSKALATTPRHAPPRPVPADNQSGRDGTPLK